ncbi:MAG: ISAzo13 family transposase, partial [Sphingomonas bacterium]|nr:ISAzo13 family transposase [Sphingomonas bacterium]
MEDRFDSSVSRCCVLGITCRAMIDLVGIQQRWDADGAKRDERGRRVFAASEARAAGYGGLAALSEITGLARS